MTVLPNLFPLDTLQALVRPGPGYLLGTTADGGPVRWDPAAGHGALQIIAAGGSGRTHLARAVALQAHERGHRVVVLDARHGTGWEDLAVAGATVHTAGPAVPVQETDEGPGRASVILQAARDLVAFVLQATVQADTDPTPPTRRTLVVVEDAHHLVRTPPDRADRRALARALEDIRHGGRLAGVDLVVTSSRPFLRDPNADTVALARVTARTVAAVGLAGTVTPTGPARFLVAAPTGDRHRITAPDTRPPGGIL